MNTSPGLPIRPPILVHHTASLDGQAAPPNSLEAIRASLDAGAAFIEIDITALADADYLLVHDDQLESETSGSGPVAGCTASEARKLHFKAGDQTTEYAVPLLSDVTALFLGDLGSAHLQLDFKNMIPFPNDEPLSRLIRLIEPLGKRVIVSTGADWQLRKLHRLAPWLDLGFDIGFYLDWRAPGEPVDARAYPKQGGAYGYADDHPLAMQRFWSSADYLADRCGALVGLVPGVSTFYISHVLLAHSLDDGFNWADALHASDIKLDAWTLDVGNPEAEVNARRLLEAGVDQFTTNTPLALSRLLGAS